MSLQQWLDNSWISPVERSRRTVTDLLGLAEDKLADASLQGMSADTRFTLAYDAVRTLCDIALHASGHQVPKGQQQHQRVLESLQFTLDGKWSQEVDYFDRCRRERHKAMYERSGIVQGRNADQLLDTARALLVDVREWLGENHADLV